jgi:hypothetical protein
MDAWAWLIVAVGATVGIALTVFILRGADVRGAGSDDTDYRSYFVLGLVMLLLGIGLGIVLLTIVDASWVIAVPLVTVGLVFLSIGAGNRDRWSPR